MFLLSEKSLTQVLLNSVCVMYMLAATPYQETTLLSPLQ